MTRDAAALVAILCIMGGFYTRKLWQASDDVRSLKQRLANARRFLRRSLAIALLVGFVIYGAAYHYVRMHGG